MTVLAQYYSGDQIKKNDLDKHVAQMVEKRCIRGFGGKNWGAEGQNHLEDLGVDETIILKCIFKKSDGAAWTRLMWLRIATGEGLLLMR
jgi:hypothetical protein